MIENYKHNNTSTIIGTKNPDQLKSNLYSTGIILNAVELKKIDQVSALPKEYPGWMLEQQGNDRKIN